MAKIERSFNIPLRKEWLKAPKYKRAKKAIAGIKVFLVKHMRVEPENVKVGEKLNLKIWENGIKNPPHHVKVNAVKEGDVVKVELEGFVYKEKKKSEPTKEKKKGLAGKLEELKEGVKEDKKEEEEKPEEKKEKPKPAEAKEKPKTEAKPKTPEKEEKPKQ